MALDDRANMSFRRLLLASSLGSVIENYDFFLYAFTAPIVFDAVFFPKLDPAAGLVAVYATFAIGFVARPVGGVVFGTLCRPHRTKSGFDADAADYGRR